MQVLIWIFNGVVAGWLAGRLMKGRDYGLTGNMILGTIGSVVGGWIMRILGFTEASGTVPQGAVSALGAVVVLAVARWLRPAPGKVPGKLGEVAAEADLEKQIRRLGVFERRIVSRLVHAPSRLRDPNQTFEEQMTFGQRVADRVASFGGSWTFIGIFVLGMLGWIVVNTTTLHPVDAFPFILLNLMLSCLAALQAPVIMMSQNRQAAKDRHDAKCDYEVNLRAELEISRLHAKFDERLAEWEELVETQRRQIAILERIIRGTREATDGGATSS
jgi:uncharacterized membrane protein/uncharacterized membrane protein YeaQ/YmgE (transglycosylase-associated protein family)